MQRKTLNVHYQTATDGRIHWALYDEDRLLAVCPPHGYADRAEAEIHLGVVIEARHTAEVVDAP